MTEQEVYAELCREATNNGYYYLKETSLEYNDQYGEYELWTLDNQLLATKKMEKIK